MTIRRVLTAILLFSIALRIGSALVLGASVDSLPGIADQVSYDMLARQLDIKGCHLNGDCGCIQAN